MNTIILTLDFINDICDPAGKIARAAERIESNQIIEHANQILAWGRKQSCFIAHVKVGFRPDYAECPAQSPVFSAAKKNKRFETGQLGN